MYLGLKSSWTCSRMLRFYPIHLNYYTCPRIRILTVPHLGLSMLSTLTQDRPKPGLQKATIRHFSKYVTTYLDSSIPKHQWLAHRRNNNFDTIFIILQHQWLAHRRNNNFDTIFIILQQLKTSAEVFQPLGRCMVPLSRLSKIPRASL